METNETRKGKYNKIILKEKNSKNEINNNKNRKYIKIKIKKLKVSKTWTKVTKGHGHPLVMNKRYIIYTLKDLWSLF